MARRPVPTRTRARAPRRVDVQSSRSSVTDGRAVPTPRSALRAQQYGLTPCDCPRPAASRSRPNPPVLHDRGVLEIRRTRTSREAWTCRSAQHSKSSFPNRRRSCGVEGPSRYGPPRIVAAAAHGVDGSEYGSEPVPKSSPRLRRGWVRAETVIGRSATQPVQDRESTTRTRLLTVQRPEGPVAPRATIMTDGPPPGPAPPASAAATSQLHGPRSTQDPPTRRLENSTRPDVVSPVMTKYPPPFP